MQNPKQVALKIKNHVETNKVAYVMGAVAVAAIALQQRNRIEFDKFLTSKGIDLEEYYCPEAYEEKQNQN
jgi:hypothetical protein